MGWEFVAAGLLTAIVRLMLIIYGICWIVSSAMVFFLTIEVKKKWILRLVLPFPLAFLLLLSIGFVGRIVSGG